MVVTLSLKVGRTNLFGHDCSVVLAEDGEILYGVEDERFSRQKHGSLQFPKAAIEDCLATTGKDLSDVDEIIAPYDPRHQVQSYKKI
ncbi:carbamoyltransferase N-terminal domain-containing protein [Halobaculum sp. MBLA0147]|uniref:carbamoyltransferase N-terminal domain-containing protein n=1 Tax=Halobaculum sp. MBLA0147 TaxID=3079934 RepID=UPI003524F441